MSDDERRKYLAMTARMEGQAAIARSIGVPKKVSEMELIALCNFARVGLLAVYSEIDGEVGGQAAAELEHLISVIRETFAGGEGQSDGLMRLATTCAAMLGGERYGKYVAA